MQVIRENLNVNYLSLASTIKFSFRILCANVSNPSAKRMDTIFFWFESILNEPLSFRINSTFWFKIFYGGIGSTSVHSDFCHDFYFDPPSVQTSHLNYDTHTHLCCRYNNSNYHKYPIFERFWLPPSIPIVQVPSNFRLFKLFTDCDIEETFSHLCFNSWLTAYVTDNQNSICLLCFHVLF